MKFRIVIEPDEDGVFVASCPGLPGCHSQGATRSEAVKNMREAMEGYLESLKENGDPVPQSIDEEVIEIPGHGGRRVTDRYDERQVEEAYRAVRACALLLGEHLVGCSELRGCRFSSPPPPPRRPREALEATIDRLRRLESSAGDVSLLLDPMSRDLPGLTKEPVVLGNMVASSWASAVVGCATAYCMFQDEWERVAPDDDVGLRELTGRVVDFPPDLADLMVRLEIEEAQLRERARAMKPEV